MTTYLETRRQRKDRHQLNWLEVAVVDAYKDELLFDAEPAMAIVGERLLLPMYNACYQLKHVLALNSYWQWLVAVLVGLVADPGPLLRGEVHGLSYFNTPLNRTDDLLKYALHTPARGDADFLRLLRVGLTRSRV